MDRDNIKQNAVYIVQFRTPMGVHNHPHKQEEVLAAQLIFFEISTGQLCYRKPKSWMGFLVPSEWEGKIAAMWEVGQEADLY